jgi:Fe2+ transport system protein FeoA
MACRRRENKSGPMNLAEAPMAKPLRILRIAGGEVVRRRLLSMGFHPGDVVELDSMAILKGPILVRSAASDNRVALGRAIARKIEVEVADGRP